MKLSQIIEKLEQFDEDDDVIIVVTSQDGDERVEIESGTVAEVTAVEFKAANNALVITATVADDDNEAVEV